MKLNYIPSNGSDVLEFSYDEVKTEIKKWRFSLIGVVVGPFVLFTAMERYVKANWTMVPTLEIHLTESGVYMFTFTTKQDMEKVLNRGPWMVGWKFGSKVFVLIREI